VKRLNKIFCRWWLQTNDNEASKKLICGGCRSMDLIGNPGKVNDSCVLNKFSFIKFIFSWVDVSWTLVLWAAMKNSHDNDARCIYPLEQLSNRQSATIYMSNDVEWNRAVRSSAMSQSLCMVTKIATASQLRLYSRTWIHQQSAVTAVTFAIFRVPQVYVNLLSEHQHHLFIL
jgi:hypothetical protein